MFTRKHTILLVGAALAFTAAVVSFVLIRERDFVAVEEHERDEETPELAVAA